MNETVRGKCTKMCPDDEIRFRESHKLLHVLEMVSGTERLPTPKADTNKVVKIYTRSAAGLNIALPKNLRTPDALLETVYYLLHDVISYELLPCHALYDFIANRLLAVRQDMLVQRVPRALYISLLEPIIRFYTYSAYRLCQHPVAQFDPVLNNRQLQECLKKLLKLYDEQEYFIIQCLSKRNQDSNLEEFDCICSDNRPFFEALYIIFNISDISAIYRGLSLRKKWRTEIVNMSLNISILVRTGNWYRACRLIKELPTLLAAIASLHLPRIRRNALKTMSVAYHSKNLKYPISALKKQLLYDKKTELMDDCAFYNLKVEEDGVKFNRENIFISELIKPRHEMFVEEKLFDKTISSLVLEGNV